ncbi:MAG: hypothetical protein WB780_01240 [Candidatus Acidiferrales bacterium]
MNTQKACLALLSLVVLVSTPLLAQQSTANARTGTLTRAAVVDPLHRSAAQSQALAAPAVPRQRGARMLHPKNFASFGSAQISRALAPGQASQVRQSAPTVMDFERSHALLANFDGVSSLDSGVTNFGAEFEPPDQGLCVGNGFVVEPVNSAFTIYRRNGSVVTGPFNVNVLFDEGLLEFTSDPRCHFDKSTNTWFATILFISADNTEARTDIAVNSSGDPTTPWTVYHLEATDDGTDGTPVHVGCPCFGDQPLLGIDRENIYIATNEFSILGPQVNGAQVYALSKRDLIRGAANVHFVQFQNLTIAGNIAFSVQPALTQPGNDSGDAEYFLESIDPTGTFDNRIGVWALTRQEEVSDGRIPTLTSLVINSEVFGVPPNAVQEGSTSLLNTGDDRMQQVQFINGQLWGELNTALTLPGDPTQLAANAWFHIRPRVRDNQISDADITAQGYLASPGNFVFYPAIQATPDGSAAMVFTLSGTNFFGSAAYSRLADDGRSFGPIKIAALGSGPYDPNATRWGDYSWAVADPDGRGIWLATEYIPPPARQTADGLRNWGTRVLEVSASDDDD